MATYRLWPSTSGGTVAVDSITTDLGQMFSVSVPGCHLDGYFQWLPTGGDTAGSNYNFRLYSTANGTTGTLIGSTTVSGSGTLTAGVWTYVPLGSPVSLTAGTTYVAVISYSGTNNHYAATSAYWSSGPGASGISNGPLTAPGTGTALNGASNSFNEPATGGFPASASSTNYWLDIQIDAPAASLPAAQPGQTWLRQFRHRQQPPPTPSVLAPVAPPPPPVNYAQPGQAWLRRFRPAVRIVPNPPPIDLYTSTFTSLYGGAETPNFPVPGPVASAGQTWRRYFQHPQQSPTTAPGPSFAAPASAAGTGSLTASGFKGSSGTAAVRSTGTLTSAGAKAGSGTVIVTGTGTLTSTGTKTGSGTATVAAAGTQASAGAKAGSGAALAAGTGALSGAGAKAASGTATAAATGSLVPVGGGAVTVLPPSTVQAGQTWLRFFRHPQQLFLPAASTGPPAFSGAVAGAGTGTLTSAGAKADSGAVAGSGSGSMTATGSKSASGASSAASTGSVVPAGSGAVTVLPPSTAQPGPAWLRFFRPPRQTAVSPPAMGAGVTLPGTGTLTAAGAKGSSSSPSAAGTGTITAAGVKGASGSASLRAAGGGSAAGVGFSQPLLPLIVQAGQTWLRFFRHPQQSPAQEPAPPPPSIPAVFIAYSPRTDWDAGDPATAWEAGYPVTQWQDEPPAQT